MRGKPAAGCGNLTRDLDPVTPDVIESRMRMQGDTDGFTIEPFPVVDRAR